MGRHLAADSKAVLGKPLLPLGAAGHGSGGGAAAAAAGAAALATRRMPGAGAVAHAAGAPPLVVLTGQRGADLASICRALQGVGVRTATAGQSSASFMDLALLDAELVHPEREPRLGALLRSGRLRGALGGSGGGGGGGSSSGASCVVLAFDSAGERLPLLGQYGKLEKLHALLLRAGVPPERILFAGTREARPEAQIFAPGGLAPGFVQRLGQAQLAELQRDRYVPTRFMVWGREATPAQMSTLRAWLGGISAEVALLQELTSREEEALENMINNMRAIKAAATAANAASGGGQPAGAVATKPATGRSTTVHWA